MSTLNSYITDVRRLLHDANGNFWSNDELTDYINDGRERIVRDTGCLRTLQVSATPLAPDGTAATITIGAVTTGAAGSNVVVTNSGTSTAAILNFTIPKGDPGDDATVTAGTNITVVDGQVSVSDTAEFDDGTY